MKNKILSFLLVALASTSYAQEATPAEDVEPQLEASQIPVEQVAVNEDDTLDTLGDYSVTAYRFASPQLDTPVNTTVITADDIAESFSTNIADVLQTKANIRFNNNWSGGSGLGSINMRGFADSSNNVLVIIDGQRMNRADMGALNWNQIPLEYVDSIEVMRGSQTAMYGNNALGGVIKITTKRGSAEDTYSANFSGGSYGTYNVNGLITGSAGDWSWSADVGRYATDGYRDNDYAWTNSYNLSATNKLSDALSLRVSASFSQSEFGMSGGLTWDEYLSDPTQVGTSYGLYPEYGNTASISSENDCYAIEEAIYTIALSSNTDFGEGEIAFSASTKNIYSNMPSWGAVYSWEDTSSSDYCDYYTISNKQLTLDFTPRYKFKLSDEANLIVGVDAEYIDIDSAVNYDYYSETGGVDAWYTGDVQRYTIAPYIAGDLTVADKFIFNAGARYEYSRTSVDAVDAYGGDDTYSKSLDSEGLAANIGVTYRINKNSSVYFRFDQVYNQATTDEVAVYQGYNDLATGFNADLKPEHGQNIEIGYKYIDENWTANANAFVMILQDEIYYNTTYEYVPAAGWSEAYYKGLNDNYDDPTLRYGFEYQVAYDDKYWGASLMGTIMKAEFLGGVYDGCDMPLVPNFTNMLAVYVQPTDTFRVTMTLSYTSSSNLSGDYYGEYNKASDYFLLGFIAELKLCDNATLYFGVENALDENYISWGSADSSGYSLYPGMGRVFKAGLNLTF